MESNSKAKRVIVGIKFSPIGKSYYFDASKLDGIELGIYLIVETSRGWQMGQLVKILDSEEIKNNMRYKPVDRIATSKDLEKKGYLDKKSDDALEAAQKILRAREIKGIKVISAEYSFDEKTVSFLYSSENENQMSFSSIINQLKNRLKVKKVDFHKIGPRDVAKYYGGMGACGLEKRCCVKFLNKFESISIRMAKTQGISLTPSDITGICDRLRCCLGYEYCTYVDAIKGLPKRNKIVRTPMGLGKVKDIAPLRKSVFVAIENHGTKEFGIDEIEPIAIKQNGQNQPKYQSASSGDRKTNRSKRSRQNRENNRPKQNRKKRN